jgi:phosphoglycolate phosphatase-like HAD superfamily hydrolase
LQEEIHKPGPQKGVLPGVRAVLEALQSHTGAHLALLTGNFERGAQIKLEYFDLWRYFGAGAFGDRTHDRNSLLETALARVAAAGGPSVTPADTVVVGDTPLDVAVAVAGGARSLAVATGSYGVEALRESGADVVVEDLMDIEAVLEGLGLASGPG